MSLESFPQRKKKPDRNIKRSADEKKHKSEEYMTEEDRHYLPEEIERKRDLVTLTNQVIEHLCKRTLHKGLILLGRVSRVDISFGKYILIVSLPNRFEGYVKDVDVSQSYRGLLQKPTSQEIFQNEYYRLSDLFKPGDYVVCYVKDIHEIYLDDLDNQSCYLSLEPQLINLNVRPNNLVKGFKIICSVKSKENRGYTIDTGILNVIAFLATEDVEKGKQYLPNTQLLCTVKEVETVGHTTVVKLSTKKKKKLVKVDDHDVVSLDVLIPGTKFSLRIKMVMRNGLQVYFGKDENTVAYIHQIYLKHPLSTYKPNRNVTVTLLYTMAEKKIAFFSELDDMFLKMEKLRVGDIIEKAKFLYRDVNGVILKLSESGLRGYVTFRKTGVPIDKIKTVFKKDSIHKCRVLQYNWVDHLYICTTKEEILKEIFSLSDVNIGDIITVTIEYFTPSSIFVTFGYHLCLNGTISKMLHLSDNGLHGLRLTELDKVKAKVLNLNPVEFTLKQSLINSKLPVLKDFSEAKCGSRYHGTITVINKEGLWVRFYGTVTGLVPYTTLNSDWNFCVGQTVQVYVTSVDKNLQEMKLEIVIDIEEQQFVNLSIGDFVEGIVTESYVEGVYLKVQKKGSILKNNVIGFLPAGHLAPSINVGKLLVSSYTPGTVITGFVFATEPTLILSRDFITNGIWFDSLRVGDNIPCTIRGIFSDGVTVILPIKNYSKLIFIPYKDMCNFSHMYMLLYAKITAINKQERELTLTTSLKAMWESLPEYELKLMRGLYGMKILTFYLKQLAELGKFYKNKPISSVTLGQKVIAIVEKVTENGLVLRINDHLEGVVRPYHYRDNPKEGDKVFGTILWKNYVCNVVEVTLIPVVINCITPKQDLLPDLPVTIRLRAKILLVTKFFVVVIVNCNYKGYLAVMPVRYHMNDTAPDLTSIKIFGNIQVYVVLNRRECDIVPTCIMKSAFKPQHFVTEPPTKNKQELKRKRVSESHDVDLANPSKKALGKENEKKSEVKEKESRIEDIDENSEDINIWDDKEEAEDVVVLRRLVTVEGLI